MKDIFKLPFLFLRINDENKSGLNSDLSGETEIHSGTSNGETTRFPNLWDQLMRLGKQQIKE